MPAPKTMSGAKILNARKGFHFFADSSMRFFDSRIYDDTYREGLFVSSEQFHASDGTSEPRRYTVRQVNDDGSISVWGGFQGHEDLDSAVAAIARILG